MRKYFSATVKGNYRSFKNLFLKRHIINDWYRKGCPIPPPHILKQEIIKEYASKYNIKILVETGTFLGDMVAAQRKFFDKIYSIELDNNLWKDANHRFRKYPNISILHGDSGKLLQKVVPQLNQPAIFWLDGHYSGGITAKSEKNCPINEELNHIFESGVNGHIILIDDARCFNGEDGYPKLEDLMNYINETKLNSKILVESDLIRVVS
jgi:hypothetical protein